MLVCPYCNRKINLASPFDLNIVSTEQEDELRTTIKTYFTEFTKSEIPSNNKLANISIITLAKTITEYVRTFSINKLNVNVDSFDTRLKNLYVKIFNYLKVYRSVLPINNLESTKQKTQYDATMIISRYAINFLNGKNFLHFN